MILKLFGKNIAAFYKHHIMRIEYANIVRCSDAPEHSLERIELDDFDNQLDVETTLSKTALKKLAVSNHGRCDGYVLKDAEGVSLGTIWVMYRGGNDTEYRIRNIDAYIFDVLIDANHRGRGLAGVMIELVMDKLYEKGIAAAYLAVSKTNVPAIKAYRKIGFTTVGEKRFFRVLKINIPYHKL